MKLSIIPIEQIHEGNRRRKDYGDITELAKSIKEKGLINPIAVGLIENYENTEEISNEYRYVLLAGGRRYRACVLNTMDAIPVRIYERILTNLELRSIELEENIQRKELSWKETLRLQEEIHNLQVEIHGTKISTSPDASGHSMRDTAKMLGKSNASISLDMKLTRAMKNHPELNWESCKNKNEANKLMKKVGNMVETKVLASAAKKSLNTGSKLAKKLIDSYIIRDCFDAMAEFPSNTFNFAEVDPPYGIDLQGNKKEYDYDAYAEIPGSEYEEFLTKLCNELYRILANDSWVVFWFAPHPWFDAVRRALVSAGFNLSAIPAIWTKPSGQTNNPTMALGNSYEMFFYAKKGKAVLQKPGRSNLFNFKPVNPALKVHPAERPLELIQEILKTFARPNARVIVPFAGSGKTLVASVLENMIPIGFDLLGDFKDSYTISVNNQFGEL